VARRDLDPEDREDNVLAAGVEVHLQRLLDDLVLVDRDVAFEVGLQGVSSRPAQHGAVGERRVHPLVGDGRDDAVVPGVGKLAGVVYLHLWCSCFSEVRYCARVGAAVVCICYDSIFKLKSQ
jgi:hypothetical protein